MSWREKIKWIEETMPAMDLQDDRIETFPEKVPKGLREVAIVTVSARQQDFALKPVMNSLEALHNLPEEEWLSAEFLVAPDREGGDRYRAFDWRSAPRRRYASFQEFYKRELEDTWGSWEELRTRYAKVLRGEMSEDQFRHPITNAQKRIDIENALRANPGLSSNAIAKMVGVNHRTVIGVRYLLRNSQLERTEASGRKARGRKPGTVQKQKERCTCPTCGHSHPKRG